MSNSNQGFVKLATGRVNDQCALAEKRLKDLYQDHEETADVLAGALKRLDRIRSAARLGEVFLTLEEFEWLTT